MPPSSLTVPCDSCDAASRGQGHDGDRSVEMVEQPGRHRPQQRGTDSAVATSADHDEIRVLGVRGECRTRRPTHELPLDRDVATRVPGRRPCRRDGGIVRQRGRWRRERRRHRRRRRAVWHPRPRRRRPCCRAKRTRWPSEVPPSSSASRRSRPESCGPRRARRRRVPRSSVRTRASRTGCSSIRAGAARSRRDLCSRSPAALRTPMRRAGPAPGRRGRPIP